MKPQLTISILVSDRMDTLEKCLNSITPILQNLNSELILVLTGKDPAVREIARQYTSHIIPFTWCDDFAEARKKHPGELWMQVHLPLMLSAVGKEKEALEEGEQLLRSPRVLEVGRANLHGILASLCWDIKEYEKGLSHVRCLRDALNCLEKHPEKAGQQTSVSVSYTTAKEHSVSAYMAGLFFAAEMNSTDRLQEILTWLPWDEEDILQSRYDSLEQLKKSYPGLKESILEGYSKIQTDNVYVMLQKALYAERKQRLAEAEELFRICAGNCPSVFVYQLVDLAKRNGFSLNPLIEHIPIETWDEYTKGMEKRKRFLNHLYGCAIL